MPHDLKQANELVSKWPVESIYNLEFSIDDVVLMRDTLLWATATIQALRRRNEAKENTLRRIRSMVKSV